MRDAVPRLRQCDGTPDDGSAGRHTFVDDFGQRQLFQRSLDLLRRCIVGEIQHPATRRVENADFAVEPDDEQAGGEARHDLARKPF